MQMEIFIAVLMVLTTVQKVLKKLGAVKAQAIVGKTTAVAKKRKSNTPASLPQIKIFTLGGKKS